MESEKAAKSYSGIPEAQFVVSITFKSCKLNGNIFTIIHFCKFRNDFNIVRLGSC